MTVPKNIIPEGTKLKATDFYYVCDSEGSTKRKTQREKNDVECCYAWLFLKLKITRYMRFSSIIFFGGSVCVGGGDKWKV